MSQKRFEQLAAALARRDRELARELEPVRRALESVRETLGTSVRTFVETARAAGAEHLAHVEVGPVEPDEKHVDCLQVKVRRGRWEIVCVGKTRGVVTVVGPYRRGKPEQPCRDHAFGAEAIDGAQDVLLELLRGASER